MIWKKQFIFRTKTYCLIYFLKHQRKITRKSGANAPTNVDVREVQAFLKWMERKFSLNLLAESAKRRFVKRGQV